MWPIKRLTLVGLLNILKHKIIRSFLTDSLCLGVARDLMIDDRQQTIALSLAYKPSVDYITIGHWLKSDQYGSMAAQIGPGCCLTIACQ